MTFITTCGRSAASKSEERLKGLPTSCGNSLLTTMSWNALQGALQQVAKRRQQQARPSVAMVVGFDAFNELAHARTIGGGVFGIDSSVPADRLVALQEMAETWVLPE